MKNFYCGTQYLDRETALITPGSITDPNSGEVSGLVEVDLEHKDIINTAFLKLSKVYTRIILDCTYIDYIDSSCLWTFFELNYEMEKKSGLLIFLNLQPEAARTFRAVRYDERMIIKNSYEDALEYLYQNQEKKKQFAIA